MLLLASGCAAKSVGYLGNLRANAQAPQQAGKAPGETLRGETAAFLARCFCWWCFGWPGVVFCFFWKPKELKSVSVGVSHGHDIMFSCGSSLSV